MSVKIARGKSDKVIREIIRSLEGYQDEHPDARIEIYRQNPVSVRIRIIDKNFKGLTKPERNEQVWEYFKNLPEESQSDISMLLLLTPDEKNSSFANVEFEDPVPSSL